MWGTSRGVPSGLFTTMVVSGSPDGVGLWSHGVNGLDSYATWGNNETLSTKNNTDLDGQVSLTQGHLPLPICHLERRLEDPTTTGKSRFLQAFSCRVRLRVSGSSNSMGTGGLFPHHTSSTGPLHHASSHCSKTENAYHHIEGDSSKIVCW